MGPVPLLKPVNKGTAPRGGEGSQVYKMPYISILTERPSALPSR